MGLSRRGTSRSQPYPGDRKSTWLSSDREMIVIMWIMQCEAGDYFNPQTWREVRPRQPLAKMGRRKKSLVVDG